MAGCDLVFLDPDNSMLPKSVSRGSDKSVKYVLPEEIMDYYEAGYSVVFYSYRTREQVDVYQMLCAIYALDVVIETEQRAKENEM